MTVSPGTMEQEPPRRLAPSGGMAHLRKQADMAEATDYRFCPKCGLTKPSTHFYDGRARGRRGRQCRECAREQMRARYADLRAWLDAYKLEHGCVECGYKEHPAALEFDHLPGKDKTLNISVMIVVGGFSKGRILEEIAKCELVCANCHRVRTVARRQHGAWSDFKRQKLPVPDADGTPPPFEQLHWEV